MWHFMNDITIYTVLWQISVLSITHHLKQNPEKYVISKWQLVGVSRMYVSIYVKCTLEWLKYIKLNNLPLKWHHLKLHMDWPTIPLPRLFKTYFKDHQSCSMFPQTPNEHIHPCWVHAHKQNMAASTQPQSMAWQHQWQCLWTTIAACHLHCRPLIVVLLINYWSCLPPNQLTRI